MNFGTSISVVVRGAEESGDVANVVSQDNKIVQKTKKNCVGGEKKSIVASKVKGKPQRLGLDQKRQTHRWQAWSG